MKNIFLIAGVFTALAIPATVNAQSDTTIGAGAGAVTGAVVGGPPGAVVGAGIGAIAGAISDANRPRFREYSEREHRPSFKYDGEVHVGTELPKSGVTYYEVPREYGAREYRYTVVNDRTVLVDPRNGRIIQVID